jgi:hypothetical protein
MRKLLHTFNWKNFLQRTILFFLVFLIIRFLVDWIENDLSLNRVLQQSLIRYLIFGMILGLLDSDTWYRKEADAKTEELTQFKSTRAAFFHYTGVAFFISLLCGVILVLINLIRWLIGKISGTANNELFPDWNKYLLVIAVIGICFATYDAIRNYLRHKRKKEQI